MCDEREARCELHILDAAMVSAGPICRLEIPVRVPLGFHATWIDANRLPAGTT